jgi:hypothetical protein
MNMSTNELESFRRRQLLFRGGAAAAGSVLAPISFSAVNADGRSGHPFRHELEAGVSRLDLLTMRNQLATLFTNPAIPALAASTLQNHRDRLTSYQISFLEAIAIMTRDPAALRAKTLGIGLYPSQKHCLESIAQELRKNPAIKQLLSTAAKLKHPSQAPLLGNYIAGVVSELVEPPPISSKTGDAALDSIICDARNLISSGPFEKTSQALIPLMQRQDFIPFLRTQPTELLANFIPEDVRIGLLPPTGSDYPLTTLMEAPPPPPAQGIFSTTTRGVLEVIGAIGGAALVIITAELTVPVFVLTYTVEAIFVALGTDDIIRGRRCGC